MAKFVLEGVRTMIDKTTNPKEAIEIAIKREHEAYEFYKNHAKLFEDEGTKQMFMFLAAEEKRHEEKLQQELDDHYQYEM
jgi:rubrerythrin